MEIFVNFRQKANINPKDVIEKLIEDEIGYRNWVFEREGKFYRGFECSAGSHSFNNEIEITLEKYNYIKALQLVLNYLK